METRTSRKNSGATLLELLIATTLLIVISSLAVPAFQGFRSSSNAFNITAALRSSIHTAQAEALKRRQIIRICASRDGVACDGQWHDGWIVYAAADAHPERQSSDPLIQFVPRFRAITAFKNGTEKSIKVKPDGAIGLNRTFHICDHDQDRHMYDLVVIQSGRVSIRDMSGDCPV